MKINYRPFKDSDKEIISGLIQDLYKEDNSIRPMTAEKIRKTFEVFKSNPGKGSIVIIEKDNITTGYSILINFWSNEFGGNILFVDELYIKKEFRGHGIATDFIKHLTDNRSEETVALQLQVTPDNAKARKLYERIGFKLHKNNTLVLDL